MRDTIAQRNEREAVVEHHPLYTLGADGAGSIGGDYRILGFWASDGDDDDDFIAELERLRKQRMLADVTVTRAASTGPRDASRKPGEESAGKRETTASKGKKKA